MDKLNTFWDFIENIGVPILALIGGLSFFSINFYLRECHCLRKMEEYIQNNKNLIGFKNQSFPIIWFEDVVYSFKRTSDFDPNHLKFRPFQEQLSTIKAFRKFYKIVFPIVITLAIIGMAINGLVIDK